MSACDFGAKPFRRLAVGCHTDMIICIVYAQLCVLANKIVRIFFIGSSEKLIGISNANIECSAILKRARCDYIALFVVDGTVACGRLYRRLSSTLFFGQVNETVRWQKCPIARVRQRPFWPIRHFDITLAMSKFPFAFCFHRLAYKKIIYRRKFAEK